MTRAADAWGDLPRALQAAADRAGGAVDVPGVLVALAATVEAFQRRRAARGREAATLRHLRAAAASAEALQDALDGIGDDREGSLGPWPALGTAEGWLEDLARLADHARHRLWLAAATRPARRDDAARAMVLETAWVLARAGLPVSSYPGGPLGLCARAVAARAGRPLPDDDRHLRRWLLPAVHFVARNPIGAERALGKRGLSALTKDGHDSVPSPASRPVTH